MTNPVTGQPVKGRPGRTAAVFHEGILVVTAEERAEARGYLSAVERHMEKAEEAVRCAAENYWRLGKLLLEVVMPRATGKIPDKEAAAWFGTSATTIRNCLKLARSFDSPDQVRGQPLRALLGRLKAEERAQELSGGGVRYALPPGTAGLWDDECFALPTLSGVSLSRHRLRAADGTFYLLCKDFASAIPVARLSLEQPRTPGERHAYNEMLADTQRAFERYYAAIEAEEAG